MTAFLDTPQAARRRRAFLAAMTKLVGRDSALEAINLWEQTYGSDQPLLRGVSQYAALVVAELNWPIKAPDLAMTLLEYLQKEESSLPPDPLPILTGRRPSGPAVKPAGGPPFLDSVPGAASGQARTPLPQSRQSAVTRTLGVLLLKLCDQAGQADQRSQAALIKTFLTNCASQYTRDFANDVALLLSGRNTSLTLDYTKPMAVGLINSFYVALAHVYGPISADRIVTSAVRAAQEQPEAREFSPRDLL
jgi:hypothetical protein